MNPQIINQIADLSQIEIQDMQATSNAITDIFALINQLQAMDTSDIEPLNFPLDILDKHFQPVRVDKVLADVQKTIENAPLTEKDFFLVPKVID